MGLVSLNRNLRSGPADRQRALTFGWRRNVPQWERTRQRRNPVNSQCLISGGERGRNRTYNLVIKSHLLCQLSYAPAVEKRNFREARDELKLRPEPDYNTGSDSVQDHLALETPAGWDRRCGRGMPRSIDAVGAMLSQRSQVLTIASHRDVSSVLSASCDWTIHA